MDLKCGQRRCNLSSDLQSSFWTFAFPLQYLPEEPCCLLGAASVNCEAETCVAIVVNHLKESRGVFRHLNDTKPMCFVFSTHCCVAALPQCQ